ncbi:unnamed protein product, partial [marine sediment metagenome]
MLAIEKIGPYFFFVPIEQFHIDFIVSLLLVAAGVLLDIDLHKLAKEKGIKNELMRANMELSEANAALQESLAHIKVLKGLIPICAECKKVRDDKGYWKHVEEYIREHS